jgi:hypothetical protein
MRPASISSAVQAVVLGGIFAMPLCAQSQGVYNDANLFINGVEVYVDGIVSNSGEMQNDGLIVLTGDWKSQGKYGGAGTLRFNGTAPQRISHYGQSVSSVVIDGWGTKYVKGILNISSSLALEHGIIEVSDGGVLNLRQGMIVMLTVR